MTNKDIILALRHCSPVQGMCGISQAKDCKDEYCDCINRTVQIAADRLEDLTKCVFDFGGNTMDESLCRWISVKERMPRMPLPSAPNADE